MKLIACALALLLAGPGLAAAACDYPPEVAIPDGNSASEEDMRAANAAVREYMAQVEAYLACLDDEEKALGDTVTDEQKKVHTARHNAAVDALNTVAGRFNEQVRLHKARSR